VDHYPAHPSLDKQFTSLDDPKETVWGAGAPDHLAGAILL
jgi:hypothetical protein